MIIIVIITTDLPGSFQSALHGALTGEDYSSAVRGTIRIGGCNASRSGFIGACMGAGNGPDGVPESWRQRTHSYPEILDLAKQLTEIL
ncbi:hypothetical protein ACOMHN_043252 [Nucella lapillus]